MGEVRSNLSTQSDYNYILARASLSQSLGRMFFVKDKEAALRLAHFLEFLRGNRLFKRLCKRLCALPAACFS